MQIRFINRNKELNFLNSRYKSDKFELIILHGRRRIGKSYLIRKFLEDKKSVYLQADQTSEKNQLEHIYIETTRQLEGISRIFLKLDDYLEYLTSLQNQRLVIIFDEFQYMVQSIKGIASILQRWIDNRWNEGKLFIILCGSEIRMMEELFAYHNPLYGRRTGQLKIEPFEIPAILDYFPEVELEVIIQIYGVFGSIPAYLSYYNPNLSLIENIKQTMLSEGHPLFEEPLYLLRQEFREIGRYFSILQAVAGGETRLVNISNKTGIDARTLPKYLSNMIATNLLLKEVPVSRKRASGKYVQYRLDDQYLRFWFKFVIQYKDMLLKNGINSVTNQISKQLDNYMGLSFEKFVLEMVLLLNVHGKLPDTYTNIGRWWKKGIEIDIVGISDHSVLCIEVKYGKNIDGRNEMKRLNNKIKSTLFKEYKSHSLIVAQGFSSSCDGCITINELLKLYLSSESEIIISYYNS